MVGWKKRRSMRYRVSGKSRSQKRNAVRQIFSESPEQRMLLAVVTGSDPLANSHNGPTATDVSATYDEAINAASATSTKFVVTSRQAGATTGTVSASGMSMGVAS